MAERGAAGGPWKRHVLRQLQRRDRRTAQTYNKLLEKSFMLGARKLRAESLALRMELPARSVPEEPADSVGGEVLDSAQMLECLKRSYEEHIVELQRINEELTCEMMERNTILKAKKTALAEQSNRLASVSGQFFEMEATRRQLKDQVEELSRKNAAVKAECDALRERYRRQDLEFRWAAERGLELLKSIMRMKVEAAEHRNEKNERVKQGRLSKELKKATRKPVDIGIEPEEGKEEEQKMARTAVPKPESREKPWRRPFRSASATSMTLTRYVDVFKGMFDFRLKRGNSVSSPSEDHYCRLPSCVAACLPSVVSDTKEAHLSEINAVKFSPSSNMVATGGTDRLVRLWSVAGGRLEHMQMLEGATGGITSLDFDPSGYHLLGASYNNVAQLWKIGDGKCREILTGHADKVTAAKFRSTRHQAVTGSRDRTVKEWDLCKGACSRTINVFSYCNDIACCDTVIISGHHDKTIRFWDSREPGCTQVIPEEGKVTSLSISADQLHLLSCSRDNALKVIDLRMHNVRQVFRAEGFKCGSDWTKAVFSPDKSYALVGSADGTLFLWNIETGHLESSLAAVHGSSVNAVAWSPSGLYIGSVDQCRKLVLWT
ncbi:PREDICTED: autophagy-related protein 16-2 [Gekko japonicus]|uniref:Autophagy-related protein 16-2 n=1 Tax=Gekko japonicus TaxID=146911 RepID=A0ABM1JWV9_GEKJA|nr:PREDICTED: autophagy-related protein 16-2 [Gekko japonicus]